jgi:hypothetical protein
MGEIEKLNHYIEKINEELYGEELTSESLEMMYSFYAGNSDFVRSLCIKYGIQTSEQYYEFRKKYGDILPEYPNEKYQNMSWWEYLHPQHRFTKKEFNDFRDILIKNKIKRFSEYIEWYNNYRTPDILSPEKISEGWFGINYSIICNIIRH